MDDPWGSPWANNDGSNNPSLTNLTLEPPPRVLLSAKPSSNSNSHTNLSVPSPWANNDDDGLGEWPSAGDAVAITPNSGSLNPWASWGDVNQQPTPRRDSPKKESLAAWPASASTASSPSLRPLPPSHSPSGGTPTLSRQPSFDPWKSGVSMRASVEDLAPPVIHVGSSKSASPHRTAHDDLTIEPPSKGHVRGGEDLDDGSLITPRARSDNESRGHIKGGAKEDGHSGRSRSSSRSSHGSSHKRSDKNSPVTSVDEEAGSQSEPTQAFTKVQELVELFDGLAKNKKGPKTLPREKRRKRTEAETGSENGGEGDDDESDDEGGDDEEDEEDFGDFEDATEDEGETDELEPPATFSPLSPTRSRADEASQFSNQWSSPISSPKRRRVPSIKVEVEVPLDLIDKLFPPPEEPFSAKPTKGHKRDDSLEQVIYDTFAETSERRTWYRTSRFGSMLRNDAADFENYTSVSWPNTKVHEETLQIVRKWRERETLGWSYGTGGNGSSGGFGWDSAAPTVSMEEIFGRKRGPPKHISTASESRIQKHMKNLSNGSKSPTSPGTAATFGWSTTSPTETTASRPTQITAPTPAPAAPSKRPLSMHQRRDILHRKQTSNPWTVAPLAASYATTTSNDASFEWGSFNAFEKKEGPDPSKARVPERSQTLPLNVGGDSQTRTKTLEAKTLSAHPLGISTTTTRGSGFGDEDEDEDDEWGEMVSSPTMDASPFPPPAQQKLKPIPQLAPKPTLVQQKPEDPKLLPQPTPATEQKITSKPTSSPPLQSPKSNTLPVALPLPSPRSKPPPLRKPSVEQTVEAVDEKAIKEIVDELPDLSWILQ
ncbi:hypothetical protein MKZ38_008405 [Zalerion maritima]|uniref:Uncharacterized protein n=1 Tax=Zalerion maritima TaxID=339359 RepID=A0AAD5RKX9_9PEZI|nr:hypothetical protein MKZ38_008405 [Zalerion maritima]